MADENNSNAGASSPASSALANTIAEETILRLTEEKKVLEEKNKKLAQMLDLCAKNADESAGNASGSAASGDIKEQLAALKKYVSDSNKKLEKSINDASSEQWKSIMAEMKARFSAIEEKISTLDSIKPIQKKLDELEAEVRDKRRHGGNPFGKIGTIAGGGDLTPTNEDEDKDIVKKLEEFEQKMDKLGNRISAAKESESSARGSSIIHKLEGMLPGKVRLKVEKFTSRFSRGEDSSVQAVPEPAGSDTSSRPSGNSSAALSDISFKPVEDKVSEEAVEGLIFDNADISSGKLKIKLHEPSDFDDVSKIQEDIRAGDVLLVDIRSLRQNDMELLRKITDRMKKTCAAIDGSITGIGDNYLIVMPKNVQLHKE